MTNDNLIGEIGLETFKGAKIHRYLSYTRIGGKSTNLVGKSRRRERWC